MTKSLLLAAAVLLAACGGSSNGGGDGGTGDGGSDAGVPDGGSDAGCTVDTQCQTGSYCAGTGCGTVGDCELVPTSCAPVIAEVCGCDGNSYDSACKAFIAGTRVASDGTCPTAQCTALFNQIVGVVDAGQSCSVNTDCVVDRTPCGVGPCWAVLDTASDQSLSPLVTQYSSDSCGPTGTCGSCTFVPSGAICDGGFCSSK